MDPRQTFGSLGEFLKDARDRKGFSLRAVEKATGISNAYLSQLESQKIKQPSPTLLHKLCELYEVSYNTAMELVGYPIEHASKLDKIQAARRNQLADRIGPVTRAEEDALVEYLEFLRSRRKKEGQS